MANRVVRADVDEAEINCGAVIICFGLDKEKRPKELSRIVVDLDGRRVPDWQYRAACAQAAAAIKDHRERAGRRHTQRPAQLDIFP